MAKDDLHLLMFKVLAYLYECMKGGKRAERKCFKAVLEQCRFDW